uniref:Uncharacterized protein n=1 Tax=Anguilla anguilla TaxID=7936 RepID=A0A0E9QWZ1_ANGAN
MQHYDEGCKIHLLGLEYVLLKFSGLP